jgi:hypothetical protein
MTRAAFVAAALLFTGCATPQYGYLPATTPGQAVHVQRGRASYDLPPEKPMGTVRVMSGGVVELKPSGGGEEFPALHLRLLLSNQSSVEPWSVKTDSLTLRIANSSTMLSPTVSAPDTSSTHELTVARGELKSIDLYFKLPENRKGAEDVHDFDFHWLVLIGGHPYERTTSFDRVPKYAYYYGGAPWPYYPYYYYGFYGPPFYNPGLGVESNWGPPPPPVVPAPAPAPEPVMIHH